MPEDFNSRMSVAEQELRLLSQEIASIKVAVNEMSAVLQRLEPKLNSLIEAGRLNNARASELDALDERLRRLEREVVSRPSWLLASVFSVLIAVLTWLLGYVIGR